MKIKTQKLTYLVLVALLALNSSYALAIAVEYSPSPEQFCLLGEKYKKEFYGNPTAGERHLTLIWTPPSNKISYISSKSRIKLFLDGDKVKMENGWVQTTTYTDSAGDYYLVWNNAPLIFNYNNLKPADRGKVVAQVVFKSRISYQNDSGKVLDGGYFNSRKTDVTPVIKDLGRLNLKFDTDNVDDYKDCLNISVRWCGDGVKDDEEECDPKDSSQSGLSANQSCSASCKVVP